MILDINRPDLIVGVVGAGAMGRGIAQVAATGGCTVYLYDAIDGAAKAARSFIATMLERAAEKGRMSEADAKSALARVEILESPEGFAPCHVVIEAVVENVDIKRKVFAQLEAVVDEDVILASNTSSISVTSIASGCARPQRVAGMHFFNPVPLMKLVEIIDGARTAPWVCDVLSDLGRRMGRKPVKVGDAPGFLVNQVGRGLTIESAHIAADGIAGFAEIDQIMRDGAGFRMGPFELMDLTAIDVTHPATELIYRQSYDEPRYRPASLMQTRLEAGLLGRKVGQGFYDYPDGIRQSESEDPAPPYDDRNVWISQSDEAGARKLRAIVDEAGGTIDGGDTPGSDSLILVTPIGEDATAASVAQGLDPARTIAVDTLFGLKSRRTIMKTVVTKSDFADAAHGLLGGGNVPATLIHDSPGFVAQRVVAMIVNIGCSVAQSRIASPEDIDKAVTLGLGYPKGPLAFGDAVGAANILKIQSNIYRLTGDPRYRPSPWLRRRADVGTSLLTPDS